MHTVGEIPQYSNYGVTYHGSLEIVYEYYVKRIGNFEWTLTGRVRRKRKKSELIKKVNREKV